MTRMIYRNPFEVCINFTDEELILIREIAMRRQFPKDNNLDRVTDKRIIQRDNVETHLIGLLGEFAVAKLINGNVDTKSYLSGDRSKDFYLFGVTVEVKTLQGYLTFKKLSDFISDVSVLVIYKAGDYHQVWVQGWISRYDFRDGFFMDDFGYGQRPCMQPAALIPIQSLKAYCLTMRNIKWIFQHSDGLGMKDKQKAQPKAAQEELLRD